MSFLPLPRLVATPQLRFALVCWGIAVLAACGATPGKQGDATRPAPAVRAPVTVGEPPAILREFRGVWVATVANIDWPSRRDLTVAEQQAEIVAIVRRAHELNLNAIILQVRTSADALYDSKIEPWSEYLTGEQGRVPDPYYDPLTLWITEAHKRGIELHAWFNPYRARHTSAKSPNAWNHIANTNPAVVKSYGGFQWLDPGEPTASEQTVSVILDVVRRYDVDGVQIDDYFYPYPVAANANAKTASADGSAPGRGELPFPDDPSWQAYLATGGTLDRADWRRQNVDTLVERIYQTIKQEKPHVKFGISPFGLGRPDRRPAGITGFSQYDKLYADAELWLQQGWLDYFAPQLYWSLAQPGQAYGDLLNYWAGQNTAARHVWPGLYTSRVDETSKSWQPEEILDQIDLTRQRALVDPHLNGHLHFSMVALAQNRRGLADRLRETQYRLPALVPASPWLGQTPPAPPVHTVTRDRAGHVRVTLAPADGQSILSYAVWSSQHGRWRLSIEGAIDEVQGRYRRRLVFDQAEAVPDVLVISAIDRVGNESSRIRIDREQLTSAVATLD